MRYLIATELGRRPGDFHHTDPAEPVVPGRGCRWGDRGCTCTRAWVGVDSGRATTTAQVVGQPPMTAGQLAERLSAGQATTDGVDDDALPRAIHMAAAAPLGVVLAAEGGRPLSVQRREPAPPEDAETVPQRAPRWEASWIIDVEADTPREAAEEAAAKRARYTDPEVWLIRPLPADGEAFRIDLSEPPDTDEHQLANKL